MEGLGRLPRARDADRLNQNRQRFGAGGGVGFKIPRAPGREDDAADAGLVAVAAGTAHQDVARCEWVGDAACECFQRGIFPESVKGHDVRDVLRFSIIKAEIHRIFDLFISSN